MLKMATSAGSRPPKHGRPKLGIAMKQIGLQANIYDEWITKKKDLGFADKSTIAILPSICLVSSTNKEVRYHLQQSVSLYQIIYFIILKIFAHCLGLPAILCFAHVCFKVRVIQRLWESRKDPIQLIILPYLPWRMNLVMMSKSMST